MKALTTEQVRAVGLPKWPGLLVVGEPITKDLAAEIIVRTDRWSFSTNDHTWKNILSRTLDLPLDEYTLAHYKQSRARAAEYGVLEIGYLHNEQIASCYVGGPHVWVDWDGRVGCSSWNIGKWPSAIEVLCEWEVIAEAFPALSLRCQLLNHENGYPGDNPGPVIEYVVKDGRVEAFEPTSQLAESKELDMNPVEFVERMRLGSLSERGCTLETFKHALSLAKGKVSPARRYSSDF